MYSSEGLLAVSENVQSFVIVELSPAPGKPGRLAKWYLLLGEDTRVLVLFDSSSSKEQR